MPRSCLPPMTDSPRMVSPMTPRRKISKGHQWACAPAAPLELPRRTQYVVLLPISAPGTRPGAPDNRAIVNALPGTISIYLSLCLSLSLSLPRSLSVRQSLRPAPGHQSQAPPEAHGHQASRNQGGQGRGAGGVPGSRGAGKSRPSRGRGALECRAPAGGAGRCKTLGAQDLGQKVESEGN